MLRRNLLRNNNHPSKNIGSPIVKRLLTAFNSQPYSNVMYLNVMYLNAMTIRPFLCFLVFFLLMAPLLAQIPQPTTQQNADSLENKATQFLKARKYAEADTLMNEALAMRRRLCTGDHPDLATGINHMALYYNGRGRYAEAEPLYTEALAMRRRLFKGDHPDLVTSINNMARFYKGRGRYVEAESLYKEALAMSRQLFKGDHNLFATTIDGMASFYNDGGRYAEAEALYKDALAMCRRLFKGDHDDLVTSINNMAVFYDGQSRYDEAEPLHKEALAMYRRLFTGDHPGLATIINNMGWWLCNARQRYAEAEPFFKEAFAMRQRLFTGDHPDLATGMSSMAALYSHRGLYIEAESLYKDALAMRRRLFKGDHPDLASSINSMATFYEELGRYTEAEPLYKELLDVHLKILDGYFPSLSEVEKEQFWATMSWYFERFNSFVQWRSVVNSAVLGQMYNNQLSTKGLLLATTSKVRSRITASGDTTLLLDFKRWQAKREALAKYLNYTTQKLQEERVNLDSLTKDANDLEKALSKRSEAFANEFDRKRPVWQDVRAMLKQGEAAVEIVRYRTGMGIVKYVALVLTPAMQEHPDLVLFSRGEDMEGKMLERYQQRIRRRTQFELDLDPDYESYKTYWLNLGNKLKGLGVKRVYLSPDGVYHQINVNTLLNPATKQYLLDELDVRILTSTRDLISFRTVPKQAAPKQAIPNNEKTKPGMAQLRRTAELFGYPQYMLGAPSETINPKSGDPIAAALPKNIHQEMTGTFGAGFEDLPGAKAQVETISATLEQRKWKVVRHLGAAASEEALKSLISPNVLHIATHGFFLPDIADTGRRKATEFLQSITSKSRRANPLLRSGLALAGANNTALDALSIAAQAGSEDGILTAYEAMNLHLDNTELVDLSACETGLGMVKAGEGVYGLQRAFRVAGAKALIMSLRPVNDEATHLLMSSFYRLWSEGKPKQEAFRAAQNELRKAYPIPYYWGGFVMVGE